MKLPIPEKALKSHTGILGMTGSGKTTTAKLIIEHVVAEGARVCILDPIKSDWWGLTSSADGKRAGLPFQILGGPHGHVPLHSGAGKVIGELVARGSLPLSIIDMADFEAGGLQAFFCDFAATLMKRMKGVLYLPIEEAHEFAPKERAGIGKETLAIHFAKKLAIAGRTKGIRMMVLTQRTQALHNALLGSCETMIMHRFISPADQEPVLKWLKGNLKDKEKRAEIEDSMSGLEDGQAWIVSGRAKVLECRQFPRPKTYDNTATPDDDDDERQVRTAVVDVDKLRGIIGEAVVEAEANDPKKLRARISELERATKQLVPAKFVQDAGPAALKLAEERGFERGIAGAREAQSAALSTMGHRVLDLLDNLHDGVEKMLKEMKPVEPRKAIVTTHPPIAKMKISTRRAVEEMARTAVQTVSGNGSEPPSVRKILDTFHKSYPVSLSFDAAARRAGISSRSSSYNRIYRKAIAASPELERDGDRFRSRPEFAQAGSLDASASIETWADRLPPTYAKMLRAVHQHGPIDRATIAAEAGVSPTSSGLGTGLQELLRLQLIVKGENGYQVAEGLG